MGTIRKRSGERPLTLTARQVNTVAQQVAEQLRQHTESLRCAEKEDAQNLFTLFMQRFDSIDTDMKEIKHSIIAHIEADSKVHDVVKKHQTYWGIAIKSVLGLIAGAFTVFVSWFRF